MVRAARVHPTGVRRLDRKAPDRVGQPPAAERMPQAGDHAIQLTLRLEGRPERMMEVPIIIEVEGSAGTNPYPRYIPARSAGPRR